MNKKHVALIVVMVLLSIVLIIGGTYAFFLADIDNSNNEQMKVTSGEMILSFTDTDAINLTKAQPGSVVTKTFTVESIGSLATKYNLKFTDINNTFKNNEIYYTLTKGDEITAKGYISSEYASEGDFYIATNIPIGKSTDEDHLHTYTLTIEFISKNKPQNDNQEATFTSKINADNDRKAEVHVESLSTYCSDKPLSECMIENYDKFGKELIDDDPDANIRYMGANPNNYIWFNCDSYENLTNDTAEDEEHNCERWRIIGSFKNIEKVVSASEDGETTYEKQNLVKIIRADSIGRLPWDNSGEIGSNNWTEASLQRGLNGPYLENNNSSWITSEEYTRSGQTNIVDDGYKSITINTKEMIEKVKWNTGGWETASITVQEFYIYERGEITYGSNPSIWDGYIGLMYPSDYGYATNGNNNEMNRADCLITTLKSYSDGCHTTNWLLPPNNEWTLTPYTSYSHVPNTLTYVGWLGYAHGATVSLAVRPSLYLTHDTKVTSGDGTYEKPYVIGVN